MFGDTAHRRFSPDSNLTLSELCGTTATLSAVNPESRYHQVSRRALITRGLALGALVVVPGVACGSNDDSNAFGTSTTGAPAGTSAPDTASADTASAATVAAGTAAADTAAPAVSTASGATFPAGGQLTVGFTYAAASAGGPPARNPYIAVWIENADGDLVKTISLWMKPGKDRYLDHLTRWYDAEVALQSAGGDDQLDTITGATKVAGAYTVAWDGVGVDGGPVAQGDYFVCIEAAREHGPYELIREAFTLGSEAFDQALADNGELSAASVALTV